MDAVEEAWSAASVAVRDLAFAARGKFTPRQDRLRYNVHPEVLAEREMEVLPEPTERYHTLVGSRLTNGKHAPVLDLDRVGARLVPSTTDGNYHLYLDGVELTWKQYRKLLKALRDAGVIEEGYYDHSLRRGQTLVRRPGLRKLWHEENSVYNEDLEVIF